MLRCKLMSDVFFFKQKTAYEMRISDWSSDVCSSDLALRAALRAAGVEWEELPDEGAFYGPKIEYHLKDSIGRSWQVGTMQYDPMMPERRSEERRVGKECVSTCSARGATYH